MPRRAFVVFAAAATGFGVSSVAQAGMPSFTIEDVRRSLVLSNLTRQRIEAISFFFAGFMICARVIQWIWNGLRKDVPILPRLSYGGAVGLVTLWGLLFVLVLTMISGARELLTPGAWEKAGLTYRLIREPAKPPADRFDFGRYYRLERLAEALREYAAAHDGRFPMTGLSEAVPKDFWVADETSGERFLYVSGQLSKAAARPLAYEPDRGGEYRLVLFTNQTIELMSDEELRRALETGRP
jgi:hypothetical protein